MYISSDGSYKDTKQMNGEYLINALSKANREIYNVTKEEEFYRHENNIELLENELRARRNKFLLETIIGKENEE